MNVHNGKISSQWILDLSVKIKRVEFSEDNLRIFS